jgi:folate-dependent phosphoribosylglycinamide formyltransferase PurN
MILFTYNFHHQKTQNLIFYCQYYGYSIDAVFAAEWRDLGFPEPKLRTGLHTLGTIHPADLCRKFAIPYHVVDHNSNEAIELLSEMQPKIGLIAGARILYSEVIDQFSKGIINFHPGLIPEVRGLDCVQWAIFEGHRIGVTSHLIDGRVDAGCIIKKIELPEYPDDTILDLGERLNQGQLKIFFETIDSVTNDYQDSFTFIEKGAKPPNSHFPTELLPELAIRFAERFPNSAGVRLIK